MKGIILFLSIRVLPVISNSLFIVTRDSCRDRVVECLMSSMATTSACGNDGVTYSYCQIISKQCQGHALGIEHLGDCLAKSECFSLRKKSPASKKPTCNPDGTFTRIQCHQPSGYCWCVTPLGKRLSNTLIQHLQPHCPPPLPESPENKPLNISKRHPSTPPIWKRRWQCEPPHLSQFIENLISKFSIEFTRLNTTSTNKTEVISWKFSSLDANKNDYLDWTEYEELLRLIEKVISPRKCFKLFSKVCDADGDMRISKEEWINCLMTSSDLGILETPSRPGLLSDDEASDDEEDNRTDCPSKRALALKYQRKTDQENLFIPECEEGRYKGVQCYSGFCWCVDGESGVSVPGTSIKGGKPNCSNEVIKVMRGCPDGKYKGLINDMMGIMKEKFEASGNVTDSENGESAAVWTFFLLDRNKNEVLQRGSEWRSIRMMVQGNRCGKKLPRFCDVDGDFKLTITEWLNCFNIEKPMKDRGKNPISMLHSV